MSDLHIEAQTHIAEIAAGPNMADATKIYEPYVREAILKYQLGNNRIKTELLAKGVSEASAVYVVAKIRAEVNEKLRLEETAKRKRSKWHFIYGGILVGIGIVLTLVSIGISTGSFYWTFIVAGIFKFIQGINSRDKPLN